VGIRQRCNSAEIEVVGEAANAHEGLKLLETAHPDIAIVDIGLPDKDGIEPTRQIKTAQENGEKSIPKC